MPREDPELRLLNLCPLTRALTGLPSSSQALEHGALGPSTDLVCRAGATDFGVQDGEGEDRVGLDVGYFPKQRGRQAQSLNLGFIETLSLEPSYTRETGVGGGGRGGACSRGFHLWVSWGAPS